MKKLIILAFLSTSAFCWELMLIESVSTSGKTFVTRSGKEEGFIEGAHGTFTTDELSIQAKAIEVSRDYAVWQIKNSKISAPFKRGETVTFNLSQEAVWLKVEKPNFEDPETAELYAQFTEPGMPHKYETVSNITLRGAFASGVNESISNSNSDVDPRRRKINATLTYGTDFSKGITVDFGVRLEREQTTLNSIEIESNRNFLLFGTTFYIRSLKFAETLTPFISTKLGIGQSSSRYPDYTQSGFAYLLPDVSLGVNIRSSWSWSYLSEAGFESIHIKEETLDQVEQAETQQNTYFAFGLKYHF